MLKQSIKFIFSLLIALAHRSYGIEGVNALLLVMPAKLIVPTLRKYGAQIGEDTVIHSPLIIHNADGDYRRLAIGSNCYLGRGIFLDIKDSLTLEDRVTVSMRVTMLTHTDLGESDGRTTLPPSQAPVRLARGSYVGANATILQGVNIREGAVVGAASLIREDVAPGTVVAGNPARVIKTL